jgi:hypothetical protein
MCLFQDVRFILAYLCVIQSYVDQTYISWRYKMRREGPKFIFLQEMSFLGCYRLPTAGGNDCLLGNSDFTFP